MKHQQAGLFFFALLLVSQVFWNSVARSEVEIIDEPIRRFGLGLVEYIDEVALAPAGNYFALAGTEEFWLGDAENGAILRTLPIPTGNIQGLAFSADGLFLLVTYDNGTVRIWDITADEFSRTLMEGSGREVLAAFSPDGNRVATTTVNEPVCVWDVETGAIIRQFDWHDRYIRALAFSHDGEFVASSGDSWTHVWRVDNGVAVLSVPRRGMQLAFSADDARLAVSSHATEVWDIATGETVAEFRNDSWNIDAVALNSDGQLVTVAENGDVCVWVEGSEEPLQSFRAWGDWFDLSADGRHLLAGKQNNSVRIYLYDTTTGEQIWMGGGHGRGVADVAFSPDGGHVLSGSYDYSAVLWNSHNGAIEQFIFTDALSTVGRVAFSPDASSIYVKGSIYSASTGTLEHVLHDPDWVEAGVAFFPDGTQLLTGTGGEKGYTTLWDTSTWEPIRTFDRRGSTDIAISADGRRVLLKSTDGQARLINPRTGEIDQWLEAIGERVALSPDGKLAITGPDIRMWDTHSGDLVREIDQPFTDVVFHPGGQYFLTVFGDLFLWETATGELVRHYVHDGRGAGSADFSPDGSLIVSGGSDGIVRIWPGVEPDSGGPNLMKAR